MYLGASLSTGRRFSLVGFISFGLLLSLLSLLFAFSSSSLSGGSL